MDMSNNPHYHISKVTLVSPLAKNECQRGTFQLTFMWLLAVALLFRRATEYRPSNSENVKFLTEQTDRIRGPYSRLYQGVTYCSCSSCTMPKFVYTLKNPTYKWSSYINKVKTIIDKSRNHVKTKRQVPGKQISLNLSFYHCIPSASIKLIIICEGTDSNLALFFVSQKCFKTIFPNSMYLKQRSDPS
jgi:hypothetical protein